MCVAALLDVRYHAYIPLLLSAGADAMSKLGIFSSRPLGGDLICLSANDVARLNVAAEMAPVGSDVLEALSYQPTHPMSPTARVDATVAASASATAAAAAADKARSTSPTFLAAAASSTADVVASWLLMPPKVLMNMMPGIAPERVADAEAVARAQRLAVQRPAARIEAVGASSDADGLGDPLLGPRRDPQGDGLAPGPAAHEHSQIAPAITAEIALADLPAAFTAATLASFLLGTRYARSLVPRTLPTAPVAAAAIGRCPRAELNRFVAWTWERPVAASDAAPGADITRYGMCCDVHADRQALFAYESVCPPGRPATLLHLGMATPTHCLGSFCVSGVSCPIPSFWFM